jgi:PAS domain S-box-containing protein
MKGDHVLIVDDNADNLYFMRALLQGHGYDVISAVHGADALDKARRDPPDLVIADILMPVMDGFSLCREWNKDEQLRRIPFVFYTATYTDERDREFALSLGAARFIVKPQEPEAFMGIVEETIQRAEASAGLSAESSGRPAEEDEVVYLKQYNETLIRKLETKMAQLEDTNRALVQDIAVRQATEEALRQGEIRLRRFHESGMLGVTYWNMDGTITDANDRFLDMLGYAREDLELGRVNWRDVTPKEYISADELANAELRATGVSRAPREKECIRKDGTRVPVIITAATLDEERLKGVAFVMDISALKKAEADRERLLAAIEQAGEIVMITDIQGTVRYVNPAFTAVTGYSREEVQGQNPRILKSGKQDGAFYEGLWTTIAAGRTWEGRIVNKRKDGTLYTEAATISPVRDHTGSIVNFAAVKRDITEQIRLTDQLQQAQKMESVGRLAGGVAHDYNNILSVILGYTELAMKQLDAGSPLYCDLEEVHKAANRSADITKQLLAFARKQPITPRVLDLNETVEGMLKMLRRLIGEDIELSWIPKARLWPAQIDPSQLNQILANLCVNARDAIVDVGKIVIVTDNVVFSDAYCARHPGAVPGDYVLLALSDNGCGMSEETLTKIFEPFFTTKPAGEGTGLGLATVYGIVKQNGGFIDVTSEQGKGTAFKIYFPRYGEGSEEGEEKVEKEAAKGDGEIVLVVEDDPAILGLAEAFLKSLNYGVLTANTPSKAATLASEYAGEIHLLMTDVVMPGMNGKELYEMIQSVRPPLKCLFMSGYTADVIAHRGVLHQGVHFVQKPFTLRDLATKVREAIGEE